MEKPEAVKLIREFLLNMAVTDISFEAYEKIQEACFRAEEELKTMDKPAWRDGGQ